MSATEILTLAVSKKDSYEEYYDYAEECKKIGSLAFVSFKKNGIINDENHPI